jgi:hypothetical protein
MSRKFDPAALAAATTDAYSHDRYGPTEWLASCALLADRGFTQRQAETVLRSSIMRWAADAYGDDYEGEAQHLRRYLDEQNTPLRGLRGMRGRER